MARLVHPSDTLSLFRSADWHAPHFCRLARIFPTQAHSAPFVAHRRINKMDELCGLPTYSLILEWVCSMILFLTTYYVELTSMRLGYHQKRCHIPDQLRVVLPLPCTRSLAITTFGLDLPAYQLQQSRASRMRESRPKAGLCGFYVIKT